MYIIAPPFLNILLFCLKGYSETLNTEFRKGSYWDPYYLFNIFINDLFFVIEKSDICNFGDNNTLYSCGANLKTVLENLKHDACKLL